MSLSDRLADVRASLVSGAPDREVAVVAVTKGHPVGVALDAYRAGVRVMGENYAQDLVAKAQVLPDDIEWHFIGRLQRNKVKVLAPHVALWQSVDRVEVAREIASRSPGAAVLVQPNLSDDPGKGGCSLAEVDDIVSRSSALGLEVRGLMGVGVFGDLEATRIGFERLVAAADALGLPVRSIGMTDDLEVALAAGSTMVRVGRSLFGPRPPRD